MVDHAATAGSSVRRSVANSGASLDTAFAALADPTRRAVIRALLRRPSRAGELAENVAMSPPALSRHLRVLKRAGLIVESGIDDDARVRVFSVDANAFGPVRDWIADVEDQWQRQLGSFKLHAERVARSRRQV